MPRISSYAILSEPLPGGGFVLMSGYTGALELIADEIALELVRHGRFSGPKGTIHIPNLRENQKELIQSNNFSDEPDNQFPFTDELIEHYLKRGFLTKLTVEEEQEIVFKLSSQLHELTKKNPSFLIVPSYDCNYRCLYCYERPIQKNINSKKGKINYNKNNVVLTSEQIDTIYNCIEEITSQSDEFDESKEITLYGGEPFNESNKKIVEEIMDKGINKGFKFGAITNGHDIDKFINYFEKGVVTEVQITIDGPKEIHDKRRISIAGESSFDKIIKNIKKIIEFEKTLVLIRIHFDLETINHFRELISVFEAEGFCNNPYISIYTSPTYITRSDSSVYFEVSISDIQEKFRDLIFKYNNVNINTYLSDKIGVILPAIYEKKPYNLKSPVCATSYGQYIFAPDGCIYCCWESLGKKTSQVGSFDSKKGLTLFDDRIQYWTNRHPGNISECLNCPYTLICGGGCPQYAEYNFGSIYKGFCNEFNTNFLSTLSRSIEDIILINQ